MNLSQNSTLAVPLVENGELFLWLNRSLQDKEIEARYEQALNESQKASGSSNFADRLAGYVSIALFPDNPISYRNLKLLPQGFSNLLVETAPEQKRFCALC